MVRELSLECDLKWDRYTIVQRKYDNNKVPTHSELRIMMENASP